MEMSGLFIFSMKPTEQNGSVDDGASHGELTEEEYKYNTSKSRNKSF